MGSGEGVEKASREISVPFLGPDFPSVAAETTAPHLIWTTLLVFCFCFFKVPQKGSCGWQQLPLSSCQKDKKKPIFWPPSVQTYSSQEKVIPELIRLSSTFSENCSYAPISNRKSNTLNSFVQQMYFFF